MGITFNCELCGNEKSEPKAWHKKRKHHFCSRECANRFKGQTKSLGLSKKEYDAYYWGKPENKERRKINSKKAAIKRMELLGESYIKAMLSRAKHRALAKGLSFDLQVYDIIIPEYCPILNVKLEYFQKQGGSDFSPALDRIDNTKGYIKDNVQVISSKANRIKSNATLNEIEAVYLYMKDK